MVMLEPGRPHQAELPGEPELQAQGRVQRAVAQALLSGPEPLRPWISALNVDPPFWGSGSIVRDK